MTRSGQTPGANPEFDHPDQALLGLAREWTEAVAANMFIPGLRNKAHTTLAAFLHRLRLAVHAEPFEPARGYLIGEDLVQARMSSPGVLGETLTLLSQRFLPTIGADGALERERLAALLAQLSVGFVTALRDLAVSAAEQISVSERKVSLQRQAELQEHLLHVLRHDPVTGLPNQSWFIHQLGQALTRPNSPGPLMVGVLRVPQVTIAAHTHGPARADRLLQDIALQLRATAARHGCQVGYLTGDEFALATTSPATDRPEALFEQILDELPPATVDGHEIPGLAQAGVALQAPDLSEPNDLIRAARMALTWAGSDVAGRTIRYETRRGHQAIHRHQIAAAIPEAIRTGQFQLAYQPLVHLTDRTTTGVEALARWHHPTLGHLTPDEFIPLAEQTGLIEPLGLHLLRQACLDARRWTHTQHPLLLSVNVSPAQLASPNFADAVAHVISDTGHPAHQLQLEITETARLDQHHDTLAALSHLGIRVAVDDFGTGYSGIANLCSEIPILVVKTAAVLTQNLRTDGSDSTTILSHVISMCHDLDIQIIAEGIETENQAHILTRLGCDLGQGYHLGRPTPAHPITT